MDVFTLMPEYRVEDTDGYWIGRFSVCIAENAARSEDALVREDLREILREFMDNPVCTPGLRADLREIR